MDHYDAVFEEQDKFAGIRPTVLQFAGLMERELRTNDAKYGGDSWKTLTNIDGLIAQLDGDVVKLITAYHDTNREKMIEQCADVANVCMMIADVLKGLSGDGSDAANS